LRKRHTALPKAGRTLTNTKRTNRMSPLLTVACSRKRNGASTSSPALIEKNVADRSTKNSASATFPLTSPIRCRARVSWQVPELQHYSE
jgi:hypothetical protein